MLEVLLQGHIYLGAVNFHIILKSSTVSMDESSAVVWMLCYEGQGRQGPRQYARPCKASQYEY